MSNAKYTFHVMMASFLEDVSCERLQICKISKQMSVAVTVDQDTFWCRAQTLQQINGYHHHHLRRCLLLGDLDDRELRGRGDVRAEIRISEGDDAGHFGEDSGRRSSSSGALRPYTQRLGVADLSVVCRLQQYQAGQG